jgi:endo-1,4-beta-xylanase
MTDCQRSRFHARAFALVFTALEIIACGSSDDAGGVSSMGSGTAGSRSGTGGYAGTNGSGGSAGAGGGSAGAGGGSSGSAGAGANSGGAGGVGPDGGERDASRDNAGGASGATDAGRRDAARDTGATGTGGFPLSDASPGNKFVGNISTRGAIRSDFAGFWSQFSPENEGKWGSVQPNSQTSFNWATLDREYAYAQQNNIVFKQHNFIWGSQQPRWVTSANAEAAVKNWMTAFCQRYPNTKLIDVVNEPPPHTAPAYLDGIGGAGASGWDWIANAFKWAREACPNAILILNDFNNIELMGDNNHTIDIVNRIKAAGAPIDAVGAQAHSVWNRPTATVKGFIDRITQMTGLPVYITEYDINTADDAQQMQIMQEQFTMFWNEPNVRGVTLWGYIVGSTWEPNTGLMQSNGTMRPAMSWLMNFLGR